MKKMYILLMSFALISLLVGFSGCSNFDSTLSPAEDLTVEPVGYPFGCFFYSYNP